MLTIQAFLSVLKDMSNFLIFFLQTFPNNREIEKEMQMIAMCYSTKARGSVDMWSLVRGKS